MKKLVLSIMLLVLIGVGFTTVPVAADGENTVDDTTVTVGRATVVLKDGLVEVPPQVAAEILMIPDSVWNVLTNMCGKYLVEVYPSQEVGGSLASRCGCEIRNYGISITAHEIGHSFDWMMGWVSMQPAWSELCDGWDRYGGSSEAKREELFAAAFYQRVGANVPGDTYQRLWPEAWELMGRIIENPEFYGNVKWTVSCYDWDADGILIKEEALRAIRDYFKGVITHERVLEVVRAFFATK